MARAQRCNGGSVGARQVFAFDLDPDMVAKARQRLSKYPRERVLLGVGDATAIAAPAESFDAVVDFGAIHHVPVWQQVLSEVRRVLRPGGRFFFEEVTSQALSRYSYRTFLDHPKENRFSAAEFVVELERQGIRVGSSLATRFPDLCELGGSREAAAHLRHVGVGA